MVKLILALHNHQPVGNFDSVLEEAYTLSYKPFFDVLEKPVAQIVERVKPGYFGSNRVATIDHRPSAIDQHAEAVR